MRNSRKDGLLVVRTSKPYKIAKDGGYVDRNMVICKDITYKTENIAMDLEQLITSAIFESSNATNQVENYDNSDETRNNNFYDNESPSSREVEEVGNGLKMFMMMSKSIPISKVVDKFEELIKCGLIIADNKVDGQVMTIPIWEKIHRNEKLRIVFCYISFFVNPLQSVVKQTQEQEKQKEFSAK